MGFIDYPKITYNGIDVSNILFNINIIDKENNPQLFLKYYIKDEDTPESVSFKIYEDPTYSWLILNLNNMTNRDYDWPFNANKFQTYINDKYNYTSIFFSEVDINFSFSSVTKIKNGTKDYFISSYDRTFNKFNLMQKISTTDIKTIDNVVLYDNNTIIKTLKPKRIVYEGVFGVHHFENSGKQLNTRNKINSYLNNNEDDVVTNFDYEYNLNENKRTIQVLDPRLLLKYQAEMKKLFAEIENRREIIENE
jgi:hypothetical protein